MTIERLKERNKRVIELEKKARNSDFISKELDAERLVIVINYMDIPYIETNNILELRKTIKKENHKAWKNKIRYHLNKENIIYDPKTFIGYTLKKYM